MRKIFKKACLIMGMCLLATSVMAAPAMAATYPCLFYGTAEVDGAPVAADTEVTAWVEGVQVGSTLTGVGALDPDQFTLQVELEGTAEVSFKIGELNAAETATWVQYGNVEVSLTASTGVTLVSIAVTQSAGGTIAPDTTVVDYGGSQAFTITADTGYHVADVLVDGVSVGAVATYTFENVTADGTITASFAIDTFTITVTQGANGTITPDTTVVDYDGSQEFTITADTGYHVADVLVDGVSIAPPPHEEVFCVRFDHVTYDRTIEATFASVGPVSITTTLLEGVNVVVYTGPTTSLPDALSNIGPDGSAVVQVIWARADWTEGVWLYYNAAIPWGTLTELENGRAYIIVVSEACTWEIPQ